MVALVENKSEKNAERAGWIKLTLSPVCPVCKSATLLPQVLPTQKLTRYGIKLRSFFDWCFTCSQGVQGEANGRSMLPGDA